MSYAGVDASAVQSTLEVSAKTATSITNTLNTALTNTLVQGGSFGEHLTQAAINSAVDMVAQNVAGDIKSANFGALGTEVAHAALGCGVGMVKSDSSDGCAPGAAGAVVAHMAAPLVFGAVYDPNNPGSAVQSANEASFYSSLLGGSVAALVGDKDDIESNFTLGKETGQNAAENNALGLLFRGVVQACMKVTACAGLLLIGTGISGQEAGRLMEERRQDLISSGMSAADADLRMQAEMDRQGSDRFFAGLKDRYGQLPGYAQSNPLPPVGSTITPADAQRVYGTPPLNNPQELKGWLGQVLEGYPADEAAEWAEGFIRTLPAAQQQSMSDLIMMSVQDNAVAGSRREREVTADLQAQYPGGSVQNQQYLRDRNGNIVIDPNTGTGRRLDHVVVANGKVVEVVETTSLTAEKDKQILHELETRNAGGTFIRDRETGKLVEVPAVSRIERRP